MQIFSSPVISPLFKCEKFLVSLGAGNVLVVLRLSGWRECTLFPSNDSLFFCGN